MGAAKPAPAPAALEAKLGEFAFDKETPNTHRFAKVIAEGEAKNTVYVPKDVLAVLGNPDSIEVIVRAG